MGVGGCRGLMPQNHDALFLLLERHVQPPRLVLRIVRTQEGYLAERRLRTSVDDEYRYVFATASAEASPAPRSAAIACSAPCAWILDDASFGNSSNANRPAAYLTDSVTHPRTMASEKKLWKLEHSARRDLDVAWLSNRRGVERQTRSQ